MKIVRPGKNPDHVEITHTCSKCKQVVSFTRDDPDIKLSQPFDQRDAGHLEARWKRACCGRDNFALVPND